MPLRDSLNKIIGVYFSCVTKEKFDYEGIIYEPRPLSVSPLLFRGFTCPVGCGGCCPRFSLDYLPDETCPEQVKERLVKFNGKEYKIFSDMQLDHNNHHCRNLNMTDGRCGIYLKRPFSCDFELIRFFQSESDEGNRMSQQLFGRGWAFLRVDNQRGALCDMTEVTKETRNEVIRKLNRLKDWTDYFELQTWVPEILSWAESGQTHETIHFNLKSKSSLLTTDQKCSLW